MACIPAAARKQASRHLVVRPVVQEKSAQEFLFSLSMVHIRTEDYKVLDGGVSRSAMRLASTTFWYHTKHGCCLTEEICAESSQMSLVACGKWTV